ncbi:MAG TPA: RagB/SusD family nutrient uptake outer membrane protein, partial [Flavisolibacter sp.]|nr:RagB/SusD family nutrient uptake outer membrane protein [Flavisolibacter sp.]
RLLRAWYYFNLVKHYGGVPLVDQSIFSDDEKIDVPRNTYEECVNYIVAECDAAAAMLPQSYTTGSPDQIRVTKGAALAIKGRMLLYAASPLFNSGPRADDPGRLVSYAAADNERWKKAADAALAVIALKQYNLYRGSSPYFYELFRQGDAGPTVESVFTFNFIRSTGNNFQVENISNPPSRSSPNSYAGASGFPLQELVDDFDMANGLRITDPASGYSGIGDNMYANRDPRFYATIQHNGALRFFGGFNNQPVNTYTGVIPAGNASVQSASVDGIYTAGGTKTGYYRYKMVNNNSVSGGGELYRPWMLIRYAEVLLNAAEATNEYSGPTVDVYNWLKDIRNRAGITPGANNLYGLKANMTKEEMREAIQHERRVELAYEEHRFWDVRRWKIAPVTENKELHGMEITRAADGKFSYRKIVVRKHVFTDNMYFWPIPQSEITKSPAVKQNPGY